jgi:hypothetical protein
LVRLSLQYFFHWSWLLLDYLLLKLDNRLSNLNGWEIIPILQLFILLEPITKQLQNIFGSFAVWKKYCCLSWWLLCTMIQVQQFLVLVQFKLYFFVLLFTVNHSSVVIFEFTTMQLKE